MRTLIASQIRRLRRSLGRQGAIDNAASALTQHARIHAQVDGLADRLCVPSTAPEHAA